MDSIYKRYHLNFRTYKVVSILLCGLSISNINAQITEEYKGAISEFLSSEFISLLEKSKDYNSVIDEGPNLKNALANELSVTSISINANAVIEYAKAEENGEILTISDKLLPFLINYSGKSMNQPSITLECIVKEEQNFQAYYYSQNVVSEEPTLRKAIFREIENNIEVRRLSFADVLPNECLPYEETEVTTDSDINAISPPSQLSTIRQVAKPRSKIPRITIREVTESNGSIVIYGFVQNFRPDGFLTDIETSRLINVSSIDGFFVMKKLLRRSGHKELQLRYNYGKKFITDRKLLFIKT